MSSPLLRSSELRLAVLQSFVFLLPALRSASSTPVLDHGLFGLLGTRGCECVFPLNVPPAWAINTNGEIYASFVSPSIYASLSQIMAQPHYDALIVGTGFGGIYQLYSLRKLGLSVKAIDKASDVGGTWYWNRYPGAMSDTESYIYRFSWDLEDLQTYPWSRHYLKQPEVLKYLEHVVKRHDLRKHMQFNVELTMATWDDQKSLWSVEMTTCGGQKETLLVRYLITGLGLLSKQNYPDIPGISDFRGHICHTGSWKRDVDLQNKNVGVIGSGSTGVQVITAIADKVKNLVSFQRTPQYSVPSGDGPIPDGYREDINKRYEEIMDQVRGSSVGFGFNESTRPFASVPPDEREEIFEQLWKKGNGFRFMFGGFSDVTTNPIANEAACSFIRKKIAQIVRDPEKARKLQPHDHYARRPLCDNGYYEQFNRENVSIVSLRETPIAKITENGIRTKDGTEHKLDVIILATGFDAIEGSYNRIRIRGRGGFTLKDHWINGSTAYLGVAVPDFPNLLMITGPQGPFSNVPPAIEAHVAFITRILEWGYKDVLQGGAGVIEAYHEAEKKWNALCERSAEGSLFKDTSSWIFGTNVPGKKYALRFYFGGLKLFYGELDHVIRSGFEGFKPLQSGGHNQVMASKL